MTKNKTPRPVLILDFGSQYTQLIARKIRQLNIYSLIVPYTISPEEIQAKDPCGIILSGGPSSVYDKHSPKCSKQVLYLGVPVLGICYGMQLMAFFEKGEIQTSTRREYGRTNVSFTTSSSLFKKCKKESIVWMSHGDIIKQAPGGFHINATSDNAICGFENNDRKWYGVQFHPEVHHTDEGNLILSNFVFNICKTSKDWKMPSFVESKIKEIQELVGTKKVVLGISGGVDSTVLAILLHKAIGDQLEAIFIDNGLLRYNEAAILMERFEKFNIKVRHIDASRQFLSKLKGVSKPEQKRKIIGNVFVKVFFNAAKNFDFLAQGTLYPDVIESISVNGPSDKIKTHHNRVKKILSLKKAGKVLEPFEELFKDEVRDIGSVLKVPKEIVQRHPFPGPGLGVRIIGEITKIHLSTLRHADKIILEEIKAANLYKSLWQIFGVLLPVKTVGVMGDERTYANVLCIRAVNSVDGMTADWAKLPYKILEAMANRIIGEVSDINRVVYDISSKPPATIEWE